MPPNRKIPHIAIQNDWNSALQNENGTAWCSYKYIGETSVQCTIKSLGRDTKVFEVTPNVLSASRISATVIQITHPESNSTCFFKSPDSEFVNIHKKSVVSLDASPGGLGVSVCTENKLLVWETSTGDVRRVLEGHAADVYRCALFPSGIVVLSGGADMVLKIWSAETGQCPVTLRGHTAAVTDFCIVDRGKNIISVSKDGTAKLWSCGQAACLGTLVKLDGDINCCSISVADESLDVGKRTDPAQEHEVGTENKILLVGCETGIVCCISVYSKKKLFSVKSPSAVNSVKFHTRNNVLVGCQDGSIHLYNLKTSDCLLTLMESSSPVLCLLVHDSGVVFVGRADGTCICYKSVAQDNDSTAKRLQFTGSDFDPIYGISSDGKKIYTACRDGIIRSYKLKGELDVMFKSTDT